jgi:endoglucanase
MIKRLLTAILFVMAYLSATTAQTHFYVWQKDGTVTPFEISTVDSISFTPKSSSPVNPGGDAKDQMPSDAKTLASKIYLGWNIGNTLDCPGSETAWGNPAVTQSLIDAVKNAGFNAVRIPCAWDNGHATNGTIDANWLKRVKEVIDYCYKDNMYVILNIHWDGGWLENHCTTSDDVDGITAKQKSYWTQIANYFANYDEHLLFAGCNEPAVDNAEKMTVLMKYDQAFVDAVRATGGKNYYRNLIVQGPVADPEKTLSYMPNMPTDPVSNRLMLEVHFYQPWNFCGEDKDESWGKMAYFWGSPYNNQANIDGTNRNSTWGDESYMNTLFGKLKSQYVDKGYPIILGEFGAIRRDNLKSTSYWETHNKSRQYYDEKAVEYGKNNGMVPFYWDNGGSNGSYQNFCLFDRSSYSIIDQYVMDGLKEGAEKGKYPF